MISLILNTRKRIPLLKRLLESISNTVSSYDNVEVLIAFDYDDSDTKLFSTTSLYPIEVRWFEWSRPKNLHTSLNRLASLTMGDYIFVLNDDVEFLTMGWDEQIDCIDPNEIWYIHTNDNSADKENTAQYASFPILTMAAYKSLGYFMSEKFVGLGADVHLWRIFESVNRIVKTSIELDHVCHRTVIHVQNPDVVAAEMRQNSWSNHVDCWNIDISEDVERVKSCL